MLKKELSSYFGSDNDENDYKAKHRVVFCDAPGSGDTKGDAIDIANKLGLIGAMQLSQCLRVVVVSEEDISRTEWKD